MSSIDLPETVCLDPVEYFPLEVSINILKFLNGADLLAASSVSKGWYEVIGISQECMRKIKVSMKCICGQQKAIDCSDLILNSSRRYQNLEISRCVGCIKYAQNMFIQKEKTWKNVKIFQTTFATSKQALDYLEGIEKTVEELVLQKVNILGRSYNESTRGLTFPRLNTLQARYISAEFFNKAFDNVKTLREFEVYSCGQTVVSLSALMNLLKRNHEIKVLNLLGNVFDKIMYHREIANEFKFKLTDLKINNVYYKTPYHDRIQANFADFLKTQSETLITLLFENWMGIDVLKAAFRLSNLRNLSIEGLANFEDIIEWKDVKLTTNKSIVKLCISNAPDDIETLKCLTEPLTNLTCFSVSLKSP